MPTTSVSQSTKVFAKTDKTDELAPWRPSRHKMGKQYIKAYFDYFQVSAPEEDQDDRNALYCL